jgi:uncharacterized OB-fold protein
LPVCEACGTVAFPPRALCPRCGAAAWREQAVAGGIVTGVTERDGTLVAEVRTLLGPLVIARLTVPVQAGVEVALAAEGVVPVASPL